MTPRIFDVNSVAEEIQKATAAAAPLDLGTHQPLGPHQIKLLYSVLSTLPDGVAITDREGGLLVSNPAMRKLIEIDYKDAAPNLWPETYGLFLPDTVTHFPEQLFPLVRALQGEIAESVEIYLQNSRVEAGVWVHASGRPLRDEEGVLWGAVIIFRDITEYRRLEKEILDISGREQRRIGQDLHDGLCQILTGIKFMCSAALRRISNKTSLEAGEWIEIQKLVSQALREADTVAKGLYPVELEAKGLVAALRDLASKTRKLYRISCVCVCDKPVVIENHDVAIHIYRIVQEAIANAIKHGQAQNIMIWLSPVDGSFSLIVKNDGVLISSPTVRQGMGWRIMNYRAEIIGATLRFEKDQGGGCLLSCEFRDSPPMGKALTQAPRS